MMSKKLNLPALAEKIKRIEHYQWMSIAEVCQRIGLGASYSKAPSFYRKMIFHGLIEPRRVMNYSQLIAFLKMKAFMDENPGPFYVATLKEVAYGGFVENKTLRLMLAAAREDGMTLDESRINWDRLPQTMQAKRLNRVKKSSPLRFVRFQDVEPAAVAEFVTICKMNGGRRAA